MTAYTSYDEIFQRFRYQTITMSNSRLQNSTPFT